MNVFQLLALISIVGIGVFGSELAGAAYGGIGRAAGFIAGLGVAVGLYAALQAMLRRRTMKAPDPVCQACGLREYKKSSI